MNTRKPVARRAVARKSRGPRTDGDATRDQILDAAGSLIASSGYADTTAKAIAKRARVSLASINYHFESRQGLYRALLIEAHRRVISLSDLNELAGSDLSAGAKLRVFIEQLVRQATNARLGWHMDVLAREVLAPSPHINVLMQSAIMPKLSVLLGVVSEITAIPANDPALLRCFLSTLAPCTVLLLMARGIPGPLHDIRRMPPDEITDHLHRFAMAGLTSISREYRQKHT